MNKRAQKRMKEAIAKEIAERTKPTQDPNHSSPSNNKPFQETRGFTPKPAKKRG